MSSPFAKRLANKITHSLDGTEFDRVAALIDAELAGVREAASRQCDNIAFLLNHASIPEQWQIKFEFELSSDRLALSDLTPTSAAKTEGE